MASAPIIYAMADPDGARDIMTQHPTYTSGMAGVYVGSIVGAVQDLVKRSKQKLYKNNFSKYNPLSRASIARELTIKNKYNRVKPRKNILRERMRAESQRERRYEIQISVP